jgi:protease YdgD
MRLALLLILSLALAVRAQAEGPPTSRPTGLLSDHDRRTPQEPDAWPWSSIGRVNVVFSRSRRGACTGTLIAPDRVLTAAHCLVDQVTGTWADPGAIHFVAGVARGAFKAHSVAKNFVRDEAVDLSSRQQRPIGRAALARDWAILVLAAPMQLRPVPGKAVPDSDFAAALAGGETARAGYGQDRPFLLSLQRGCSVMPIRGSSGLLAHGCDTMQGDSGSPILLLRGDDAWIIGMSTAVSSTFEPGVGHRARFGIGVSATAFVGQIARP